MEHIEEMKEQLADLENMCFLLLTILGGVSDESIVGKDEHAKITNWLESYEVQK